MTTLHFATGRTGAGLAGISALDEPLLAEARTHAASGNGEAVEVDSLGDVIAELERMRLAGDRLSYMDFHSHGSAGRLGAEAGPPLLRYQDGWEQLAQFEVLFYADAAIEFHGCSVADGPEGELFLAKCAYFMLRRSGGTARGWRDTGVATHPVPGIGDLSGGLPYHYGGADVSAYVRAGGAVHLRGARHLAGPVAAARIRNLVQRLHAILQRRLIARQRTSVGGLLRRLCGYEVEVLSGASFSRLERIVRGIQDVEGILPRYEAVAPRPRSSSRTRSR